VRTGAFAPGVSVGAVFQPVECENTSVLVLQKAVHLDSQILMDIEQTAATAWHGNCRAGGTIQVRAVRRCMMKQMRVCLEITATHRIY